MGKGSSSQTSTTSGPPQAFLDAYQNVFNRAQGIANQPLQQYPIGPGASNVVSPMTSTQSIGIANILGMQGQQLPYLQAAQDYFTRSGQPITPLQFQGVENLPGMGLADIDWATKQAQGAAQMGDPEHYGENIQAYFNPYQKNVTDATREMFKQRNAEGLNQVRGNAAAHGAFGGDREAIAELSTLGELYQAQNPVLAQLEAQGYTQAAAELARQQQLGLGAGQLGLAAGQGLLGEFNTQQQADIGAQEATDWLSHSAGQGMAGLGQENQALWLQGAQALLGAGGLQQAYNQQVLNAPYEQFIQQQAYPFQTTGWLANIAEGLGGASGGTSTTRYPGPSTLGQIGGLGLAGAGLAGQMGAFSGWGGGGTDYGGMGGPFGDGWSWADLGVAADGGRITAADGGRMEPDEYAGGGPISTGIPDLTASIVPGASGLGAAPTSGGGGGLSKMFMQPVTNQTTKSDSGGGLGGILGPILSIGKFFLEDGGSVPRGTYDAGGSVTNTGTNGTPMRLITLAVPDLSKSYIPATQAPARTMGPPAPPGVPRDQGAGNPLTDALSTFKSTDGLSKLFKGKDDTDYGSSLGGAVEPSLIPLQYDEGGIVSPQMSAGLSGIAGPAQQRAQMQQYANLSAEKLQELAMRYPPTTPQGVAIARALQMRKQNPTGGYPGGPSPSGPYGASGEVNPGTTAARGGRMGFAEGGGLADLFRESEIDRLSPVERSIRFYPSYAEGDVIRTVNPARDSAFESEQDATNGPQRDEEINRRLLMQRQEDENNVPFVYPRIGWMARGGRMGGPVGLAAGGDVDPDEYIEPPPRGWRPGDPTAPSTIDLNKIPTLRHYDAGGDVDEWGMEDYLPRRRYPTGLAVEAIPVEPPPPRGIVASADIPPLRLPTGLAVESGYREPPPPRGVVAHADLRQRPRDNDVSRVREQDYGGLSLPPRIQDRGASADLPPPIRDRGASATLPAPIRDLGASAKLPALADEMADFSGLAPDIDPGTGSLSWDWIKGLLPSVERRNLSQPAWLKERYDKPVNDVSGVREQDWTTGGLSLPSVGRPPNDASEFGMEDYVPVGLGAPPSAALPVVPSYEGALGQPPAEHGPVPATASADTVIPGAYYDQEKGLRVPGMPDYDPARASAVPSPTGPPVAQHIRPPNVPGNLVTPSQATGSKGPAWQPGQRMTWYQVADLARAKGAPEHLIPTIVGIVGGESGFDPGAYNGRGEHSYGLTQINADAHGPVAKEALNPDRAMELMRDVSKGWKDFTPWSVYKDGTYRSYMQPGSVGAGGGPGRGVAGLTENMNRGADRMAGPGEALGAPSGPDQRPRGLAEPPDSGRERVRGRDRESGLAGFMNSPWMPLIAAGAGMLASRSPYPGVALGEGMLTGIKAAGQSTDRETRAQLAEVRSQRVEDQAKHMGDLVTQAQKNLELRQTLGEGKQQVAEANLTLKQQLADAATLRATTAYAHAQSQAEIAEINAKLKKQLADIAEGKGTWQQGEGPDPDDPNKRRVGMWHLPASGAEPVFHAGVTVQKPSTGEKAILDQMVKDGLAKDLGEAQRLRAEYRRDPDSFKKSAEYVRRVQGEERILQQAWNADINNMTKKAPDFRAMAEKKVQTILGNAPAALGTTPPPAAPGVTRPTPGAQGAPAQAAPAEPPPVPGARKAPDGLWYVPDPNKPGGYLRVGG